VRTIEQGLLTDELKVKISACLQKNEDLYLPYRPKRRTRATIAREKAWNRWQSSLSGTVVVQL